MLTCIHMLVLSIQLPLRRFAFSPVTHNYLEISYSCLVGGSAAPLGRNVFTWSHNGTIIDLLSPENVVVPGLGPLTSYFDLRMLWARWPSERKLPNRNEGPAPPSRSLSTLIFKRLSRTTSGIELCHNHRIGGCGAVRHWEDPRQRGLAPC